jgi:hypothetical protein
MMCREIQTVPRLQQNKCTVWVESCVLVIKPGGTHTRSLIPIARLDVLERICPFHLPDLEPQIVHPVA